MDADYSGKKIFVSRQIMRAQIRIQAQITILHFLRFVPRPTVLISRAAQISRQVFVCCENAKGDGPHRRSGIQITNAVRREPPFPRHDLLHSRSAHPALTVPHAHAGHAFDFLHVRCAVCKRRLDLPSLGGRG